MTTWPGRTAFKIRALISVYYAYMMAYRAELFLWALSSSLPFILMGPWMKAGATTTLAFTPTEFARYFLLVFVVRQITLVWVIWEFEIHVVQGTLSSKLLQPLNPVWHYLASHIAERFARLPFAFAIVGLFVIAYPDAGFVPAATDALTFCALVVLAFVLRFFLQYTFAMAAFFTERASAIEGLWQLLYLFLSGVVAPLAVFPTAVSEVLQYTPFPHLIYTPVAVLMGAPVNVTFAFAVIGVWTMLSILAWRVLWHIGLTRYTAMGA